VPVPRLASCDWEASERLIRHLVEHAGRFAGMLPRLKTIERGVNAMNKLNRGTLSTAPLVLDSETISDRNSERVKAWGGWASRAEPHGTFKASIRRAIRLTAS